MKEKFIKSTITLVIGGILTKILSMVIRIITTRCIKEEGIGMYMLILPTFNLFITIATLSLPQAISKIVAEDSRSNKKLVLGIIPLALLFNVLIITLILLLAPFIAKYLLHNEALIYPIKATAFTLPFITLSCILRGYFFGKQKMIPHVVSNLTEQLVRIIFIIILTPIMLRKGITYATTGLVLLNIISEIASILIMLLYLPKKITIKKDDLKFNITNTKDILDISLPNTMSRLISSIGLFLEPIILTLVLLKIGHTNSYITSEYGIISGYVIPIVSLPAFLSGAISSALLPVITNYYKMGKYKLVKKKLKQAIFLSLLIGIPFTIFIIIFPNFILKVMFKTTHGANYLKTAALIYLISYIQGPVVSTLQATDKSKEIMKSNLIGITIRTIALFFLTYLDIGMNSLLLASLIYNIFITTYQIMKLKK